MIVTPDDVVAEARRWVGVPFRHQGRDRNGVDCVGLPIIICKKFNLLPAGFEAVGYSRLPTGEIVSRIQDHCSLLDRPIAGCLIVIAWGKLAAHVGVFTGETMIHSYQSVGSVVEHGYRGRWVRLTHSLWALPGVAYV